MNGAITPVVRAYTCNGRIVIGLLASDLSAAPGGRGRIFVPIGAGDTLPEAQRAAWELLSRMLRATFAITEISGDVSHVAEVTN